MRCTGLALKWEKIDELRDRIRDQKKVLVYAETDTYCKPNRINAVENSMVLLPVLDRLGQTPGYKLPHLDKLTVEVTTLFEKCQLDTGNKAPYKTSMEIKKLAGFVKRRSQRKEVTKELGFWFGLI